MAAVQRRPRYKHVTGHTVGVGKVPFLHNCYHVPHVAVQKVDSEVGERHPPPLTAPHWTPNGPDCSRKGYPIETGIQCGQWCSPRMGLSLPVLGLTMGIQQPHLQLHLIVWTPNYLLLYLPKVCSHSFHTLHVHRIQLPVKNVAGLTHHPNRFSTLVCSLTLSNIPIRKSSTAWSRAGLVDTIRPSSA